MVAGTRLADNTKLADPQTQFDGSAATVQVWSDQVNFILLPSDTLRMSVCLAHLYANECQRTSRGGEELLMRSTRASMMFEARVMRGLRGVCGVCTCVCAVTFQIESGKIFYREVCSN